MGRGRLGALTLSLALLVGRDVAAQPGGAVARAEELFAAGKVREAITLLEAERNAAGNAGRRGRVLLGEYRIASGKRSAAEEPLMSVVQDYNDDKIPDTDAEGLALAARAAYLLRSAKDANTLFNKSERADKKRLETLRWRAELFLDKYDPGHAEEVLREALEIAPDDPEVKVMLARTKLDQTLDFGAAEKLIAEVLAKHPKSTGAYAVRAGLALRDMDLDGAERAVTAGLQVNPNDTELLALRAAARFLADDAPGFERAKKDTLARNPEFSQLYGIVGEFAEWEHRYDDIVVMMKEATRLDPGDAKAWAQLGLTQMRAGDEPAGLEALKRAWQKDHFNVRVFNTLNLYEQSIANEYETAAGPVFKVRWAKDERAVLERYVPRMLGEAWASMKARYGFVPKTPVQVELYASRQQFSVRTSGLPNIGIQGVCFGQVVAAMSPKSEAFNWGNVVWHELGHVFAIQMSKNHVPRWFTEGLSEYETIARRPDWQREHDRELWQAIKSGKLPGAVDMNRAFTHASDGLDVTVAYYAASQMLLFTAEQLGMPRIVDALRLWGEGVRTPEVIQRAFGMSAPEYDKRFRAWALARMKRYEGQFFFDDRPRPLDDAKAAVAARPRDAGAHVDLALALLHARNKDDAQRALDVALTIDPAHRQARFIAAKLADLAKDREAQARHLDALKKSGADGYQVQMAFADLAEGRKDRAATRAAFEAAHRFDPSQAEPLRGLFDLAKEDKRADLELAVLRRLAPLDQHDRRVWRLLMERLVAAKLWAEAVEVGAGAVYVDVLGAATHTLYARALTEVGAHAEAEFEADSALATSPPAKDASAARAVRARARLGLGKREEAKRDRDEALRLDPENADARAIALP